MHPNVLYQVQKSHTRYQLQHSTAYTAALMNIQKCSVCVANGQFIYVPFGGSCATHARLNEKQFILNLYTYVNWYTRNGKYPWWWRFLRNESIKLFLLEIPAHRIQWSLRTKRREKKKKRETLLIRQFIFFIKCDRPEQEQEQVKCESIEYGKFLWLFRDYKMGISRWRRPFFCGERKKKLRRSTQQ